MRRLAAVFAFLAALTVPCAAAELRPDPVKGVAELMGSLEGLRDPSGTMSLADARRARGYVPGSAVGIDTAANLVHPSVLWFRVDLKLDGGSWFLHTTPQVDRGEAFVLANGRTTRLEFGTAVPWGTQLPFIGNVVSLPRGLHDATLYLRIVTREDAFGGFTLRPSAWEATSGRARTLSIFFPELFTLGMILALGLLNGILGATLRDRTYLLYAAEMGIYTLYRLTDTSLAWRILWPWAPLPYDVADCVTYLAFLAIVAWFARAFLDLPLIAPLMWRLIRSLWAAVALVELTYIGWPNVLDATHLTPVLAPLASALFFSAVFAAGILAWRGGQHIARFYCVAFAGLFVGLIGGAAGDYGIVPSSWFTDLLPNLGVGWEALFLSLALGERIRDLRSTAATLQDERDALQALSMRDPLTGIANRRAFETRLRDEWRRATRTGQSMAVILIDVDRFKLYNDHYGHQRGDRVLREVAITLASVMQRPEDLVARYGGEEFAIVAPGCSRRDAARVAENLRVAIRDRAIPHLGGTQYGIVTISCGVAAAVPRVELPRTKFVAAADRALYAAKREGRDRVVVAGTRPRSEAAEA